MLCRLNSIHRHTLVSKVDDAAAQEQQHAVKQAEGCRHPAHIEIRPSKLYKRQAVLQSL